MPGVTVAGHRLDCRPLIAAPADAPTLVFLHEGLGCQEQWRALPDRMASALGWGGLVYSRRGYGQSDPRPRPWPLTFLDDEARVALPALLDACGLGQVCLYGHSDGGTIALAFAAACPTRVLAVVTEAAHVMVEDVTIAGLHAVRARFATSGLREALARYHGGRADEVFEGWSETWLNPAFRAWDLRPALAGVTCPVLAMQGADDEYGTPAQLEAIAAHVAGPVETWLIDGCGHAPHRERPDDVFARAMAFYRRVVPPTSGLEASSRPPSS